MGVEHNYDELYNDTVAHPRREATNTDHPEWFTVTYDRTVSSVLSCAKVSEVDKILADLKADRDVIDESIQVHRSYRVETNITGDYK